MKQCLFILRHAPHRGRKSQELIDMLLTAAAFEQSIGLLLLDQGVWQLNPGQRPEAAAWPDTAAWLQALPLYGVDTIYVEQESLDACGLNPDALILPVQTIKRSDVKHFLQQQTIIVSD
jgi:tRNA 2-thiouridine synthesizing protein C